MPIIAQVMIPGTIEIALRDKINKCGCLSLITESKRLNTPIDELRNTMSRVDGVVCNEEGMCCAADIHTFAEKLRRFREM